MASPAPRRRWSIEFKKRVVAEASPPGVSGAEIARRYDLNANLLFNWKNKFGSGVELVPVELRAKDPAKCQRAAGEVFRWKDVSLLPALEKLISVEPDASVKQAFRDIWLGFGQHKALYQVRFVDLSTLMRCSD